MEPTHYFFGFYSDTKHATTNNAIECPIADDKFAIVTDVVRISTTMPNQSFVNDLLQTRLATYRKQHQDYVCVGSISYDIYLTCLHLMLVAGNTQPQY